MESPLDSGYRAGMTYHEPPFILDPSRNRSRTRTSGHPSLECENLGEQPEEPPEARVAARDDTATGGGGSPSTLSSVDTPLR